MPYNRPSLRRQSTSPTDRLRAMKVAQQTKLPGRLSKTDPEEHGSRNSDWVAFGGRGEGSVSQLAEPGLPVSDIDWVRTNSDPKNLGKSPTEKRYWLEARRTTPNETFLIIVDNSPFLNQLGSSGDLMTGVSAIKQTAVSFFCKAVEDDDQEMGLLCFAERVDRTSVAYWEPGTDAEELIHHTDNTVPTQQPLIRGWQQAIVDEMARADNLVLVTTSLESDSWLPVIGEARQSMAVTVVHIRSQAYYSLKGLPSRISVSRNGQTSPKLKTRAAEATYRSWMTVKSRRLKSVCAKMGVRYCPVRLDVDLDEQLVAWFRHLD